jgi:hypothetical protein
LWVHVSELFPEETQEVIRNKFERVKGMSESDVLMDSHMSDMHIMMMLNNDNSMLN